MRHGEYEWVGVSKEPKRWNEKHGSRGKRKNRDVYESDKSSSTIIFFMSATSDCLEGRCP